MKKENFLNTLNDNELREELLRLFNFAEEQARSFSLQFGNWVNIEKVSENTRGDCRWFSDGHITIDANKLHLENDLGAFSHEIFHSAFHESPLWHSDELNKNKYDDRGLWGEAFCDCFRYFMEAELFGLNGQRS